MQTAFQESAFQTVQLAFQIQEVSPLPPVSGGDEVTHLSGIPALGPADHPELGG